METTESLKHRKESDQAGNICLINFREMAEYTKKKTNKKNILFRFSLPKPSFSLQHQAVGRCQKHCKDT